MVHVLLLKWVTDDWAHLGQSKGLQNNGATLLEITTEFWGWWVTKIFFIQVFRAYIIIHDDCALSSQYSMQHDAIPENSEQV